MECSPQDARDKRCPINNAMTYCQGINCMAWSEINSSSSSSELGYCDLIRKDK